jgi:hypothetical protein
MFFSLGIKEDVIKVETNDYLTCPECKTTGSILFCILSDYVHTMFQIPIFSLFNKNGFAFCENCEKKYWNDNDKMPLIFQEPYNDVLKKTKYPLKHFTVLLILGSLVALVIIGHELDGLNNK